MTTTYFSPYTNLSGQTVYGQNENGFIYTPPTSPTVMSDANVRENVIPQINNTLSTYTNQNSNQGSNQGQGNTNSSGYVSPYQSLMDQTTNDPTYDSELELIKNLQNKNDAQTKSVLAGISAKYGLNLSQLKESQANQRKSLEHLTPKMLVNM